MIPITATRDKSIQLIRDANTSNKLIGVVDSSTVGTTLIKMISQGWYTQLVSFEFYKCQTAILRLFYRKKRFQVESFIESANYLKATVSELSDERPVKGDKEFAAVID